MNAFTNDEMNLMMIDALTAMREYLEPEEKELLDLTDSVLGKLETISDANFAELELFPDFDINE